MENDRLNLSLPELLPILKENSSSKAWLFSYRQSFKLVKNYAYTPSTKQMLSPNFTPFSHPCYPPSHTATSTVDIVPSSNSSLLQDRSHLSLSLTRFAIAFFFIFFFLAYYILVLFAIKPVFFTFCTEIIKASRLRVREWMNHSSDLPSPIPQFIEFYQVSFCALYCISLLEHMPILNLITVFITFISLCVSQSLNSSRLCGVKKSLELFSWS